MINIIKIIIEDLRGAMDAQDAKMAPASALLPAGDKLRKQASMFIGSSFDTLIMYKPIACRPVGRRARGFGGGARVRERAPRVAARVAARRGT